MRNVILSFCILFLPACSLVSTKSTDSDYTAAIAWNYTEFFEFEGNFYSIVRDAFQENQSNEYLRGLSEGVQLTFKSYGLYNQANTIMRENLFLYLSEEDIKIIDTIIRNLHGSTYLLSEIIVYNEFEKEKLPSNLLKKIEDQINPSSVASHDLNFYNLVGRPNQVLRENTLSDVQNLINNLKDDSQVLYDSLSNIHSDLLYLKE
ncbi:hypothetical protein [Bacillus solimangrovi]|uniref:Lipoprotein n=1 Tax=Bacillus solimangrovi TaxID=1305675 RepID=A0A1E5LEL5_9BACI|nr:hypothetical protein [Bacillus solimangrovi]OEH92531.1 hypothetical protein BFG57_15455 [Bacillus solimangrovi]